MALSPGLIETEGTHSVGLIGSDLHKQLESTITLGRTGVPSDIAKVATFLASDDAGWITGEILFASGGQN